MPRLLLLPGHCEPELTICPELCNKVGMLEGRRTAEFLDWLTALRDVQARARIAKRIDRVAMGNFGDTKPVGEGGERIALRLRTGIPGLLHSARRCRGDPFMWWRQGLPRTRHRAGESLG